MTASLMVNDYLISLMTPFNDPPITRWLLLHWTDHVSLPFGVPNKAVGWVGGLWFGFDGVVVGHTGLWLGFFRRSTGITLIWVACRGAS